MLNPFDENPINADDNWHTVCTQCADLNSALNAEKQLSNRIRLNCEIEQYKTNQQIEKLTQKCSDQSIQMKALKQKIACLEKNLKGQESKNENLAEKLMQCYNAANVTVIS